MSGLNNIKFNRGTSGLGQPLTGQDHISGMVFYSSSYPAGFSSGNQIRKIFSLPEAEALGIDTDYSDEVKATGGNVLIATKGAAGDIESIFLDGVLLGSITVPSTPYADVTAEAVALRAAINANTAKHGVTAAGSSGNVALTPPLGMAKAIVGAGKVAFTSVAAIGGAGTGVATLTQFSGGTGSLFAVWHYHISEFFRMQPNGVLYVGVFPVPTYAGTEITTLQTFANGEIRQASVYLNGTAFASGQVSATQAICTALQTAKRPLSVVFHADFTSATLATLSDLSTLSSKNVSVVIGSEGKMLMPNYLATTGYSVGDKVIWAGGCYTCNKAGTGNPCWDTSYWTKTIDNYRTQCGYSISTLGATLGAISFSKVHESIAWVSKFNFSDGINLDDIGFVTGDLYSAQTDSLLNSVNDYHYIFLRKFTGVVGSFINDTFTCAANTNDYCYIEKNRTMDKCERNVYAYIIPLLNSPLYVNADGTLSDTTIAVFENAANAPIIQMEIDGELSNHKVTIDPTQNVISSNKLVLSIVDIPVGVARNIEINTGFTTKIS